MKRLTGLMTLVIFIVIVFLAMTGCTLVQPKPESPLPTPTPIEVIRPVSPLYPDLKPGNIFPEIGPDEAKAQDEAIGIQSITKEGISYDCPQDASIGDEYLAIHSLEPVTGTITTRIRLYDNAGYLAEQLIPNYTNGGQIMAQQKDDPCVGTFADLPYDWDFLQMPLQPGVWYTETMMVRVDLQHTQPISMYINGSFTDAADSVGWFTQENGVVTYHEPDEEVFVRTFRVSGIQVYLPIIFR